MTYDAIIIGAGAAGLMCAAQAGQRGKKVLLIDHAKKPGEKIRISGGGRCNFTNIHCGPKNFLSQNKHFCKSALSRYTPQDFIALVEKHGIAYHQKTQTGMQLGQMFCDESSQQIIDMLLDECQQGGVELVLKSDVSNVTKTDYGFSVTTNRASYDTANLVVACGGPSIPKMGASNYGYKLAAQFGLPMIEPRPALVPLTLTDREFDTLKALSGVAAAAKVSCGKTSFDEAMLVTHRGLSGPAILQISSYWNPGESLKINLLPEVDIAAAIHTARESNGQQSPKAFLENLSIPARLAEYFTAPLKAVRMADLPKKEAQYLAAKINSWALKPAGTEGYRKAEVTLGGVDTKALSSQTLEARDVAGLYFIGEVVDVTGHLGGHNFQWAWASGAAAGRAI